MLAPLLIGGWAIAASLGYWLWRPRHTDALALSVSLLLMWAASNVMRLLFPLVSGDFATPWAWTLLPPAHLLLLAGGYHAAKSLKMWAILFMSAALFLLMVDAWFWSVWWPLRNAVYDQTTYRIFTVYNSSRNWGMMVELALVAIPGGVDGVVGACRRHVMGLPRGWGGRV